MSPDNPIPRSQFLGVLAACGISVPPDRDEDWLEVLLVGQGGTLIEKVSCPRRVPRRVLHRVANKMDIPIHFFFHPERIPPRAGNEQIH